MAQSLSRVGFQILLRNAVALCAVLGSQTGFTEVLPDPTRPAVLNQVMGISANATSEPVLQSVLISPLRSVATISGQTVSVGDKWGDATVINIAENTVALQRGKDVQTLQLFPAGKHQGLEKIVTKPGLINR